MAKKTIINYTLNSETPSNAPKADRCVLIDLAARRKENPWQCQTLVNVFAFHLGLKRGVQALLGSPHLSGHDKS